MFRTDLFSETSTDALMASAYIGAPLIVDSFAGGGGASTGIEMALGRSPDIAINHNAEALALHAANHPETIHLSENVYRVDPLEHLKGKHIGLAWFSPDCKHFSKAKGGKPVERNIRDLCWIIPGWIERIQQSGGRVDVVIMENVEEFKDYGPLIETARGLMPDPERKGETYQKWCRKLRRLGAKMESRELRGRDFGAPTIRKRLFVILRFDGKKIVWPKPTHGSPDDPDVIAGRKHPWPIVADCIDWSIPCPSIFDTAEEIWKKHGVRAQRPLADNSHARIARGMDRFVIRSKRPFLVNLTHGGRLEDILEPARAITAAHRGEKALVAPHLSAYYGPGLGGLDRSASVNDALRVIPCANRHGLIAPVLTYAQQGGAVRSVEGQAHTITASDKDQNSVICAFMAQANNDSRRIGGVNPGRGADEAASTITQSGSHQQVVSAYIARQFGTSTGHAIDKPLGTIMANGQGKSQLIMPYLQSYYATGEGSREDVPMRTATVKPRHAHIEAVVAVPPFTEAQADRARQVADFMRAHGLWDEREFVTVEVDGLTFVIVDIGMRMLTPRELFNAQGFPPDYRIGGYHDPNRAGPDGRPLWVPFSKSVQVSCVGNSVCPPVAKALVAANCSHLAIQREVAA
ncbi:DNA cytosine methyltransferase [Sinorhizobium meliloti]|uniref:DNA cytosine methyltransferase n=1 Tax=Rhizobium meliloti TaxID=382 RepID=UPI0001E4D7E4|nr:DNA cytosine methyltransferase [Sinorhizobium meliloti]AEG04256.1 C-5 cytosine-specific DNA methylase [Sinorhizobium meliloti BL225C]MDE4545197.1 DNA cytosine methyltransferase [Sinorhizobium meliloti]MDE4573780.1 DNA cytosine methyltransferase [Sinorhizobium meliloti]SDY98722.1 DNA (cytosine-5)-methyltransferase 1 [Sinorhizobium meliloti]